MKKINLGIVIPAYNEEASLPLLLNDLLNSKKLEENFNIEILIVNDGSDDNTLTVLNQFKEVKIITHGYKMGVGAAVRTGLNYFKKNGFDFVAKLDADYQHEVNDLFKLLETLRSDVADLIYGDRFNGRINYRMPRYRYYGNKFFTYILNKITKYNITDSQPGMFVGNRNFLNSFYIFTNYNYTQQVLYSSYLSGIRFMQLPINFNSRNSGKSFIKFTYPFKALLQLFLIISIKRPLNFFGIPGLTLIIFALCVFIFQITLFFSGLTIKPVININLVLGTGISGFILLITSIILKAIDQNSVDNKD